MSSGKSFGTKGPLACHYCGKHLKRGSPKTTRDHVIPRSLGGPNSMWNRVPACVECNYDKRSRTYEEFTGLDELPPENHFRTTQQFLDDLAEGLRRQVQPVPLDRVRRLP